MWLDLVDGQTLELGSAVFQQLHLSIDAGLSSDNPFIRGLAFLDSRCGKRKVIAQSHDNLPSFAATMLAIRLHAIGKKHCGVRCEGCDQELPINALLTDRHGGRHEEAPAEPAKVES